MIICPLSRNDEGNMEMSMLELSRHFTNCCQTVLRDILTLNTIPRFYGLFVVMDFPRARVYIFERGRICCGIFQMSF